MLKKLRKFFSQANGAGVQNALRLPVNSPEIMDQLWAAYIKSKDPMLVRRIVTVLDGRDIVRDRMQIWLASLSLDDSDSITVRNILAKCVFPIDYATRKIDGSVDLDLHVAMCAKAGLLKFAELPFQLTPSDLVHLAMKSAAVWSLNSMAKQDASVATICQHEAGVDGGAGRRLLCQAIPSRSR